jgi:hypothetical protein
MLVAREMVQFYSVSAIMVMGGGSGEYEGRPQAGLKMATGNSRRSLWAFDTSVRFSSVRYFGFHKNSVLRKISTDRFLPKIGTEEIRFRYFRYLPKITN